MHVHQYIGNFFPKNQKTSHYRVNKLRNHAIIGFEAFRIKIKGYTPFSGGVEKVD
jgi:hypothetical protein